MRPQDAQAWIDEVGRDDEERPGVAELDDRLGFVALDRATADGAFDFTGVAALLSLTSVYHIASRRAGKEQARYESDS